MHPLTPLLRGGSYILLLAAGIGQQGVRDGDARFAGVALVVGTPLAVLAGYLSWRTTRYRVEGTELHITSGVLRKRDRRVPLPRVQSIDLVRPLAARIFGLAELRLEVVGGADSEARLSYLQEETAVRLRTSLLALASGREEAAEPVERSLATVPTGVLLGSMALGGPLVVALAAPLVLLAAAAFAPEAVLPIFLGMFTLLTSYVGIAVKRLLTEYGFSVSEVPEGLRLRQGLLDRRTQTIPPGRVQTIRISEPLLWRWQGWVRVEVDVAGYGAQEAHTSTLLPVAPRAFAEALVARVLGTYLPAPTVGVLPIVRWRAPLSRRRLRIATDGRHVVSCSGFVTTTTDIVPLAKVQSLRLTQGAWQRRLGLASVHVDSAGRRLTGAVLAHRAVAEAEDLLAVLTAQARAAR